MNYTADPVAGFHAEGEHVPKPQYWGFIKPWIILSNKEYLLVLLENSNLFSMKNVQYNSENTEKS